MCGIAGLLMHSGAPVSRRVIEQMTRVLAHRGPDGEGVHVDGPMGLGHRRLAVLDLSPAGSQPMSSADGRFWITYNGEIFNFREVRSELEGRGYRFRSRTDTEVILAGYQEWGPECLSRFNGMFAFALWDRKEERVWLVRDRLGVKPVFYVDQPDMFAFASEAKGILPALPAQPALNEEALHHFLSLNYTPAPMTLFAGIMQLLPGHHLVCRRGQPAQVTRYWDVEGGEQPTDQVESRIRRLLEDAVRWRLVSDVEVGAFLSGGLDSSAVVALMQRDATHPVKTFAATFREASYSEAAHARFAARALGTQHVEQLIESEAIDALPKVVWHSEELTADSSMLAVYRLAQRARQDVKVVLTGDGADELFGGYPTYLATRLAGWYRRVPRPLRARAIPRLVDWLPVSDEKASLESRVRRFVYAHVEDDAQAHASWRVIFAEGEKQALLKNGGHHWPPTARLYEPLLQHPVGADDLTNRLLYADLRLYLPNDMLVKVDRMTMAWGLEARTPYLDYRLVELVAGLPSSLKCWRGLREKALLRRVTRDVLPRGIRQRRKAGFNIPLARWLRTERRAFVEQHLLDARPALLTMFHRREIERLVSEHLAGKADHAYKLWALLCLSLWWQQFMDRRP